MWRLGRFRGTRNSASSPSPSPEPAAASRAEVTESPASAKQRDEESARDVSSKSEDSRQMLLDMGFDGDQVDRALRECGGVPSDAALMLLSMPLEGGIVDEGIVAGSTGEGGEDSEEAAFLEALRRSQEEVPAAAIDDFGDELEQALRLSEESLKLDEQRRRENPPSQQYIFDPSKAGATSDDALQEGLRKLRDRASGETTLKASSEITPSAASADASTSIGTRAGVPDDERLGSRRWGPPIEAEAEASTSSACPFCGNVFMPDSVFCRKCGKKRGEGRPLAEMQCALLKLSANEGVLPPGPTLSRPDTAGSVVGLDDIAGWETATGGRSLIPTGRQNSKGQHTLGQHNLGHSFGQHSLGSWQIGPRPDSGPRANGSAGGFSLESGPPSRAGFSPGFEGFGRPGSNGSAEHSMGTSASTGALTQKRSMVAPLIPINQAVGLTPNGALIASGQRPMIRNYETSNKREIPLRPSSHASQRRGSGGNIASSSSTSLLAAASAALSNSPQPR